MVLDKPLRCQMCDHDEFNRREVLLNTTLATLFNFDWANRSAMCFVCDRCGYVHWFVRK
jgi:predicted nucleic-acid-binding Zn-ribbon protein